MITIGQDLRSKGLLRRYNFRLNGRIIFHEEGTVGLFLRGDHGTMLLANAALRDEIESCGEIGDVTIYDFDFRYFNLTAADLKTSLIEWLIPVPTALENLLNACEGKVPPFLFNLALDTDEVISVDKKYKFFCERVDTDLLRAVSTWNGQMFLRKADNYAGGFSCLFESKLDITQLMLRAGEDFKFYEIERGIL